jgi:phenylalanyl-tRNA synthetase beta chain
MTGFGFTEAVNYAFMDEHACDHLNLAENDVRRLLVKILNPLTEDQTVMRTSLIPGLLKSMHRNYSRQVKRVELFEVGKIFIQKNDQGLPEETEILGGILSGSASSLTWKEKESPFDFYDMKGVVEGLLNAISIDSVAFSALPDDECRYTRPGHTAQIMYGNILLGLVGELRPDVLKAYDLKQSAWIFELDLTQLYRLIPEFNQAGVIPRFPATSRDATIIIDRAVEAGCILDYVKGMDEALVEDLSIFDVFTGSPISEGKKSVSFRITYRSLTETLEDEVINTLHRDITFKVIKAFDAGLPA